MKQESFGVSIAVREERMGRKKIFVVNNEETGIADFGDTLDEAINNFKKSLRLYFEAYPEKKRLFIKEEKEPVLVSRIFL